LKIIAHRGASGACPENTLSAIKKAIDIGVDAIEIDVRLSADGEVFVMHDAKINRTTNSKGLIRRLNAEYLRNLDAGSWFGPEFKGERIPTLRQVIETCKGKVELLIEVKSAQRSRYPLMIEKIHQLLDQYNAFDFIKVQSFDSTILDLFHAKDQRFRISKLIVYNVGIGEKTKLYYDEKIRRGDLLSIEYLEGINTSHLYANRKLIKRIHDANKEIYCWTANQQRTMKRLIRLEVDGIITNYPDKLKLLLLENSISPNK
jgi:glycerophosphoryl diester phosphodiesterase